MTISVIDIKEYTMVDGPGFRTSIYCAGCHHHCPGCHNPSTWSFDHGKLMEVDELFSIINSDELTNVTFTGGDPMYQASGFAELASRIKSETDKTIWCYTGFTFEQCLQDDEMRRLLSLIDVLVDGPFEEGLRNTDLPFRGSSNQRIIDVQESIKADKVVLYDLNLCI